MSNEISEIVQRYERRKSSQVMEKYPTFSTFQHHLRSEREFWYGKYLTEHFGSLEGRSILEVGAGSGDNLIFMLRLGFVRKIFGRTNCYLNAWKLSVDES